MENIKNKIKQIKKIRKNSWKIYNVKAHWTREMAEDLKQFQGIDVISQLEKQLVDEIKNELIK
jgi:hypothetical protein